MAIKQIVPIFIQLTGDGASTTYVFALANVYQQGFGGSVPFGTAGVVPSTVTINNPPVPVTSSTIDSNGNITITFTSALPATQFNFELDLTYNSGASSSSSATQSQNVVITGSTSVTVTGTSAMNLTQVGGSSVALGATTASASIPVTIASNQAVFPVNVQSSGTALTNTGGSLNVNITGGSSGNGAASATGSAVPAQAGYTGVNIAGNLVGVTGFSLTNSKAAAMAIVDGTGNQITSFGGGSQFAMASAQSSSALGTIALGYDGTNVRGLSTNASGQLNVIFPSAQAVTLTSTTITGTVAVTQSGSWTTTSVGSSASGATATGNPVQVGAVFTTSQPTVTTGQSVGLQATARGGLIIATGADTFNVTVNAALPAGTNVIGHVITDSGSTTAVTGTVTVSGTVTSNIGTTGGITVAQGSTTSGQSGPIVQGAVTTGSPTYTTAQTSPLSLTTGGALRVDASATTQPVSGTVTATQGTAAALTAAWPVTSGIVAQTTTAWTSGTTLNTALTLTVAGYESALITTSTTSTMTGGTIVFEASDTVAGTNWYGILAANNATFAAANSTILNTVGNTSFSIPVAGFNQIRARLSVVISGTGTASVGLSASAFPVTRVASIGQPSATNLNATDVASVAQASTSSGQSGSLVQGAVTTSAPTYTTAQTNPLSLDTSGNLRTSVNNTVTVSGTVTSNIGTTGGITVAQASTTSGESGPLMQGAVTTAAPTYTTAQTNPLSLDTSGLLRVSVKDTPSNTNNINVNLAASAATVTVSGTVTSNQGGAPWTIQGDSASGASNAGNPVKISGAFNTTQPTVTNGQTVDAQATSRGALIVATGVDAFTVAGTVTANIGTTGGITVAQASTTSGQSGTLMQGAVTTGSPSYTTAQTSPLSLTLAGALRVDGSAATQPVSGTVAFSNTTIAVTNTGTFAVQAAQSGTWTVQQGSPPWVLVGNLTHNNAAPTTNNIGVLSAVASTTTPTYTSGDQVLLSTDTAGSVRYTVPDRATTISLTASGQSASIAMEGRASIGFVLTSLGVGGTVVFEGSIDGTNFISLNANADATDTWATSTTTTGSFWVEPSGSLNTFRIRCTALTSGTVTGTILAGTAPNLNSETSGALASPAPPLITQVGGVDSAGNLRPLPVPTQNGVAPTEVLVEGGVFNSTLPTITSGNASAIQLDSSGRQIVTTAADVSIGGTTAPPLMNLVGGKTTDGTPQYQPIPLANGGTAVITAGYQPTIVSGTITTNTSTITLTSGTGINILTVGINGTYAGVTFVVEGFDGTVWYPVNCVNNATGQVQIGGISPGTNITASYDVTFGGYTQARVRATAFSSGTANVVLMSQAAAYEATPSTVSNGVYQSAAPTLVSGTANPVLLDVSGNQLVGVQNWGGVTLGAPTNFGTTPTAVKVGSVNSSLFIGTTVSQQAAAGMQRVGIAGGASGTAIDTAVGSTATNALTVTSVPNSTAGGALSASVKSAQATAVNIKASAGSLYGFAIVSATATAGFIMFFNTATTATTGTVWAIPIAASGTVIISPSVLAMLNFSTGIAINVASPINGTTTQITWTGTIMFL